MYVIILNLQNLLFTLLYIRVRELNTDIDKVCFCNPHGVNVAIMRVQSLTCLNNDELEQHQ